MDALDQLEKLIDMLGKKGLSVTSFAVDFATGHVLSVQCMPTPWAPQTSKAAEEFDPEAPDPRLEKLMYAASD